MSLNISPKKSILKRPSTRLKPDHHEKEGDKDIAAQLIVPPDGGWGWVVVAGSFWIMFIVDGVALTFGSQLLDMALELKLADSYIALINSISFAMYYCAAPVASGFINRFGFRTCAMIGSIFCSVGMITTYFVYDYYAICFLHGFLAGCGYSFCNMSSNLIVGFYFEKKRAMAFAIAVTGSSVGVASMSFVNTFVVDLAGWRTAVLLHAGMFGIVFFISMFYRPLLAVTVLKTKGELTKSIIVSASKTSKVSFAKKGKSESKELDELRPSAAERLFHANTNFPTAAEVVEGIESVLESNPNADSGAGPSGQTAHASRSAIFADTRDFKGQGLSQRQIKQLKSVISRVGMADSKTSIEISFPAPQNNKDKGCCGRLCHWEKHIAESRPLYKDDAFYSGKVENLPVYQKSMMDTRAESRTGLEYQMAVSRAAAVQDLTERRGMFTTAFRRVLASMMDPVLMKRWSYIMLCLSGCLLYTGFAVPFVFVKDRNIVAGVPYEYSSYFVSLIGLSSIFGRIVLMSIATLTRPLYISIIVIIIAGTATCLSDLSYNVIYQFGYCIVFGFNVAGVTTLRSLSLVELYGLEKLTNATGMIILFQGIGSLVGTPAAGELKDIFGYRTAFIFSGICMILSGIVLMPVHRLANKENLKLNIDTHTSKTSTVKGELIPNTNTNTTPKES